MAEIEQIISEYTGTVPNKNTQTNTEFMANADDTVSFITGLPVEINAFGTEANALRDEVNTARNICVAGNNFLGAWDDITGSADLGDSVYKEVGDVKYWVAKEDLADIKAKTPGVDSEWLEWTVNSDGGMVLIQSPTEASNDTTIEFTSGIDSVYDEYELRLYNVIPATDGVSFLVRTSSDGGSTWDSGSSDYKHYYGTSLTSDDGEIRLFGVNTVGSDTNETGISAIIRIINPSDTTNYTRLEWQVSYVASAELRSYVGAGERKEAGKVDGIQFSFSSGNVESGTFKLFGLRKDV